MFHFGVRFSGFSRAFSTRMASKRGMLIVLEGNDRVGKTTQAKMVAEWLKNRMNREAEFMNFPNRQSPIGQIIDGYLGKQQKMHDNVIHLLFTANRWEKYNEMLDKLNSGVSLVVDRYSYSGVAYSAAKDGADFEWCRAPESGLLKPDCILFLATDIKNLEARSEFGDEIYDCGTFQAKVLDSYMKMKDDSWNVIECGNRSIDEIHHDITNVIEPKLDTIPDTIGRLW